MAMVSALRIEVRGRDLWSIPRAELEERTRAAARDKGAVAVRGMVRVLIVAPDSTQAQRCRKPVAQAVVNALEGEGVISRRDIARAEYSYRMNPRDPRIVVEVEEVARHGRR